MVRNLIALGAMLALFGCSSQSGAFAPASQGGQAPQSSRGRLPIKHIIVVVQENRTVDNLFNGFPGANTVTAGKNSYGQTVKLQPTHLTAPFDLAHRHNAWVNDYDDGKMDGFNRESENCYKRGRSRCPAADVAAYGYVPEKEVRPYWDMAEEYTFGDELFETSQGPSFPAHQYLISGTSAIANGSSYKASENAGDEQDIGHMGGCDSLPSTTVTTIDPYGVEGNPVFPCFDRISIMDLLNEHDVSWRFYQAFGGSGQWHAPDAIRQIWDSKSFDNVRWPSSKVLNDIRNRKLPSVVYVTPTALESDHPGKNNGSGPSWVASIVNAVGESKYWNSTAIIVVWDDWGGWYDHVAPTVYNSFELGLRVPMIVISPYAKKQYVSHVDYEFGSILKFIEEQFNLPSLGTTDQRANDLSNCFNYGSKPRPFKHISAPYSAQYFLDQPPDYRSPDDDSF